MQRRIHIFENERMNNPQHMVVLQTKDQYISPKCKVLEMNLEGVMAVSPGKYPEWDEENI